MKTIKLDNKKIVAFLNEKDEILKELHSVIKEIDVVNKKQLKNIEKQKKITEKTEPKELIEQGRVIQEAINEQFKKLDEIGDEIHKLKLAAIPEKTKEEYFELKAKHEELETLRNKLGLKIQKIKDRVIPMIQKETKKHLEEFEDIENPKVVGEEVVIGVYSHLEDWKKKFKAKNK